MRGCNASQRSPPWTARRSTVCCKKRRGARGLDLILLTLDDLRATAHLCMTHSEHSMKQYGIPSVAEAAALAGAGAEARLLIPRFLGRNTTVSVAGRP